LISDSGLVDYNLFHRHGVHAGEPLGQMAAVHIRDAI
jgi:hypothetical protein